MSGFRRTTSDYLRSVCHSIGFGLHRVGPGRDQVCERTRLSRLLAQAESALSPGTVIDVGAACGDFVETCSRVFPAASYVMVEPLVEYRRLLQEIERRHPRSRYICAAATSHAGDIVINVHPDLVGSSVLRETEQGTGVNGVPRTVPAVTIDGLVQQTRARGPFLLKIDVQGAELDVLEGAARTLEETEYILCEVSLFKFFESGPEVLDVTTYMKRRGFVMYDLGGMQYRPLDNALSQIDIAFVKETGPLRQRHEYATPEQRADQDRRIRASLSGRVLPR
ncbi:FkbM family methyltransferase [Nitrospira sp. KM1]|uniref:FkbM family methyltransferase n=1 Tax=Nitrospira sp. KM1 TaxID=1936990 RepID=UPI001565EADF|nr:FkbM family methyltransferase [Nitrospira sp. KM1]